MFLSTQFQRIIYGAISCQFYFPLLGHHPKLKLSQKYQGIHHLLFFIKISVSTILQEPCYNTLHQYQYGHCKVGDHSWILLGVRGQYSQQHSTHCSCYLTAALHTLTTLLQGVLHCIPSNQCDQWMRTLHCFHQLSTSTFHVIWWQLQQQQHHSHHRDFLNLVVRTQRTATWRLETQSSDDSSHWSNTVTMSWPGWCPVTLVSTLISNSHTYYYIILKSKEQQIS